MLFVDDLGDAIIFFLKKKTKETLINIGSGKEMKIIEMKKKIDKLLGYENKIILKNSRKWDTKKRLLASIK